jgi:hypothetical protein
VDFPHLMEGFLGGRGNLGWGFRSLGVLPTATKEALRTFWCNKGVLFTSKVFEGMRGDYSVSGISR